MDPWMDGDLICGFLKGLPGYNSEGLKADRAAIAPHAEAYDAEALQNLGEDCESDAQDNPLGLFLYRASRGMQSPRFVELCARRRDEAQRPKAPRRAKASVPVPRASDDVQPSDSPTSESPPVVDPSVTKPIGSTRMTPLQVWQAAQGELQLQMTEATYDTWGKPTAVISVNVTWKIGVPAQYAKEWRETRLLTTVKHVLHGIVGQRHTAGCARARRGGHRLAYEGEQLLKQARVIRRRGG
jgi:hypothetical protein